MQAIERFAPTTVRLLLGVLFFVFGLNGFLGFIPQPPHPESAGAFLGALAATGYMFPLIKGTEVVAGALLLSNRFVPLALVLLAPVIVNIVAFHAVLDPAGLPIALVVLALELGAAWLYRDAYRSVLAARTTRAASTRTPAPAGAPSVA